jgi:hypothetical protein
MSYARFRRSIDPELEIVEASQGDSPVLRNLEFTDLDPKFAGKLDDLVQGSAPLVLRSDDDE